MGTKRLMLLLAIVIGLVGVAFSILPGGPVAPCGEILAVAQLPRIHPDYRGIVVPPNIAPLSFRVHETGDRYFVRVSSAKGTPIEIASRSQNIHIPIDAWHQLLAANRGSTLSIEVYVRQEHGQWRQYQAVTNRIAAEAIDSHIVYRLLTPQSLTYVDIGVYQRNLETFQESVLLHGSSLDKACVNCHSFCRYDPNRFSLGVRSVQHGNLTLLARQGEVQAIDTRFGHTAWHPGGQVAALSQFDIRLFFHTARTETRDAMEFNSLVGYYDIDEQLLKPTPALVRKDRLETQPTWSPDGRYLYFVSAPKLWDDGTPFPPARYAELKYDLQRIRYDVDSDVWGSVETVLATEQTGKSILTPRLSPDGRFLLFCMCEYGCFALYQPDSDLYLMDLQTGAYRKMLCSTPSADSWHAWSSNSRWIVFSSKHPTGVFTRLYFSHVSKDGEVSKPFVLPQRDPGHYDAFKYVYNVPEFCRGPVQVSAESLAKAVVHARRVKVDEITGATATPASGGALEYGP